MPAHAGRGAGLVASYHRLSLSEQELDDLRREMRAAGEWMAAELKRRRFRAHEIGQAEVRYISQTECKSPGGSMRPPGEY